ncbi:hypothetical protein HYV83_02690 [Candidatus Woesearchaeota archaeon]|nr:hypothetical protein [Candidatus Woesearchaeota archaeon]
MKVKTAVVLTFVGLLLLALFVAVANDFNKYRYLVTQHPITTLWVIIYNVIFFGFIWWLTSKFGFFKRWFPQKSSDVRMDKKRLIMILVIIVLPAVIGILLVMFFLKR